MHLEFSGKQVPVSDFIVGVGTDDKQFYIVHTKTPFFIAKIGNDPSIHSDNVCHFGPDLIFYDIVFQKNPSDMKEGFSFLLQQAESLLKQAESAFREFRRYREQFESSTLE